MWTFASERALARAAAASLAALALTACTFYWVQNHFRPVGGEISVPKLLWLCYAIALWGVLPALLSLDRRIPLRWRQAFAALLVLMLLRGAAELWMLYVLLNWSTWYGFAHDLACVILLSILGYRAGRPRLPTERVAAVHLAVTTAAFLPEMYFAWYMQAHFATRGAQAIYFVPDDPRYAEVLRVTIGVVVCLSLYFPPFLSRWLHAQAPVSHSNAR